MSEKKKAGVVMLMCAFGLMYVSFYAGTLWGKACSKASDPIEVGPETGVRGSNIEPEPPPVQRWRRPEIGELVVVEATLFPGPTEVIVSNTQPISHLSHSKTFKPGDRCEVSIGRTARVAGVEDFMVLMRIDERQYILRFGQESYGDTNRNFVAGARQYDGQGHVPADDCPVGTYFIEDMNWFKGQRAATREIDGLADQTIQDEQTRLKLLRKAGLIKD